MQIIFFLFSNYNSIWAKRLYTDLNKRTKDFCFLTSPSNNPVCASGKIKWLREHFGKDFRNFLIGANKYLCAGPNSLLIDDNEKKCKKFEEYSGNTFLWPNLLKLIDGDIDVDDTFEELFELIEKIKGQKMDFVLDQARLESLTRAIKRQGANKFYYAKLNKKTGKIELRRRNIQNLLYLK